MTSTKMQCGRILWFMEGAAYLCTRDEGHLGGCNNTSVNKMLMSPEPVEFTDNIFRVGIL